jgi:hypothetical protein
MAMSRFKLVFFVPKIEGLFWMVINVIFRRFIHTKLLTCCLRRIKTSESILMMRGHIGTVEERELMVRGHITTVEERVKWFTFPHA